MSVSSDLAGGEGQRKSAQNELPRLTSKSIIPIHKHLAEIDLTEQSKLLLGIMICRALIEGEDIKLDLNYRLNPAFYNAKNNAIGCIAMFMDGDVDDLIKLSLENGYITFDSSPISKDGVELKARGIYTKEITPDLNESIISTYRLRYFSHQKGWISWNSIIIFESYCFSHRKTDDVPFPAKLLDNIVDNLEDYITYLVSNDFVEISTKMM